MSLTDEDLATMNRRGGELVDELFAVLDVGDRQMAYLSAMQMLLSRSGLEPQAFINALTSLVSHNLCDDAPVRLAVLPFEGESPPPTIQ